MNGPLSGKQQREQLKFIAKEQRENAKLEADESRKDQLHELKFQTELAKSQQGLVHKEKDHAEKTGKRPSAVPPIQGFSDGTTEVEPLSRMGRPLSGRPHVGGRMLGKIKPLGGKPLGGSTDTVPTMLTPGEAVIPVEAAQDPKNKAVIAGLVNEGRAKKKRRGKADKNYLGFEDGTTSVPKPKGVSGELMRRIKEWDWSQAPRPKQEVVVVPQTVPYVGTFNGQPVTRNPVAVVPQMEPSVGKNIKDTANYGNEVMVPVKGYEDGTISVEGVPQVEEMQRSGLEKDLGRQVAFNDADKTFYGDRISQAQIDKDATAGLQSALSDPKLPPALKAQLQRELDGRSMQVPAAMSSAADKWQAILNSDAPPNVKYEAQMNLDKLSKSGAFVPTVPKPLGRVESALIGKPNGYVAPVQSVPTVFPNTAGGGRGLVGTGRYEIPPISEQVAPDTAIPPIEVPEDTVGAVKLDNLGIVSKSLAPQLGTIVAEAAADPEKGESWLASAIGSVFGDKGLFNKQELTRFATVAAGSLLFGGRMVNGRYQPASLPGSLKYAGLDALQQSDKRHVRDEMFDEKKQAAEGARIAEGAKNSRELYEQREKDYHSTIALEDIPIETKNDVMKWIRTQPMENAQQRASVYGRATEMLGANRSKVDKVNNGVESQKQQWLVTPNGRQLVQAYTDKNQKATFYEDPKTKAWINVNTIPNARVETHADYTSNKKMVEDSISKKIGPWVDKLSTRENGGKHSPGKADNLRNNLTSHIADIVYEMPNLDDKAIGQIVDSTVKQIDAEGNKPENLDGAGIRRAVLGNAVMHLNNSNLSLYDAAMSSDKKFVNPSITALTKYGAKVEGLSKNYGKSIGEISSGLEKEWMSEKNTATRKQYMNGGKAREKGVSPMMQWVFDIN